MAQESGFKSGLATAAYIVIGTVIGGAILAGLSAAYFSNLLPWVVLGAVLFGLVAGPIIYTRQAKSKRAAKKYAGLPRRTPGSLQSLPTFERTLLRRTGIDARPKERLKHLATVSLDTEVNPFDYYSEYFDESDVIEVEAKSEEGATFHFMVCDDDMLEDNERRTVNFEFYEGKKFTTRFKKRIEIPREGTWHFIAYTPEGEEYTTVTLTVSKVE